jgi:hypothetical protein
MRNIAYGHLIALMMLLGACVNPNNTPEVQAIQRVTQACATYDASLRSLALMRPRLSEAAVATVNQWRPVMNGFCIGEVPDLAAEDILGVMEKALFELSKIEGDAK